MTVQTDPGRSGISAAIIGLGRIASLLEDDPLREKPCTHAGAIAANPDCFLAAGMDISAERRDLFAERWGCPVYDNAETMLETEKPGIVHIATHPDSHEYYCGLAASRGVPVIVCEKPVADTLKAARRINSLQKQYGVRIITNHERRYAEDYAAAKKVLEEGFLGRLLSVRCCLYMGEKRRLIDVFWHDGTHLADALMYLCNSGLHYAKRQGVPLDSREGTAYLYGRVQPPEAGAEIPFIFELGAGRDHLVFELEFSCSRGLLRIGNGIYEVWQSAESPYAQGFRSLEKTEDGFKGKSGYFTNMLKDAVACVRDPSRLPVSGASDGLRVIEFLNSVRKWK
ncbi:Gfo/Idh/MocA family oxidoreductase [Brucepastera parasyntrophica]|uniref:Gfo/Idh/MocA family protein n=1 Tax=Brucepastera parasyntrophica TaxID=2880008 RepID=UPI00210DCF7D|nr:Gfo/Idh/MocA family oxidoreductase [Brucepastera parasyntrophica]ULQ58753.1 Gfo/Idh/MocA family oxidoreductase [Brucepastera parasyntrophica]